MTGAHAGILDIGQTFRNAGLDQLVAEGEAAETDGKPAADSNSALPPQNVKPSRPMYLIASFARPHARLRRVKGHRTLILTGRPHGAQAQVRYLGYRGHPRHLSALRTIDAAPNATSVPATGIAEVSVRYTDPYDTERASPWVTLPVLHLASFETTKIRRAR